MAGSLYQKPRGGGLVRTGGYIAGRQSCRTMCLSDDFTRVRSRSGGFPRYVARNVPRFLRHMSSVKLLKVHYSTSGKLWFGYDTSLYRKKDRRYSIGIVPKCRTNDCLLSNNSRELAYQCQLAPEPSYMPGYTDDYYGCRTFIQGSSIELTALDRIRPPYTAYVQGGLTYEHVKAAVLSSIGSLSLRS